MAQTLQEGRPLGGPVRKPRVLFVDDEKRVLNSMRALFRREYELFLTTVGSEAVRIAEENAVDVIIADQRMPEMSGVEVLGAVKERSPGTVRVLLTGYADLDAIEGSINVGEVFRFLSKPCPPQELRETLAEAVRVARESAPAPIRIPAAASEPPPPDDSESMHVGPERPDAAPTLSAVDPSGASGEAELGPGTGVEDHVATVPNLALELEAAEALDGGSTETEIIMSGDTNVEFINTIVNEHGVRRRRMTPRDDMDEVGIALFTTDAQFTSSVERLLKDRYSISRASTMVQVTELLAESSVGVMITDFCTDGAMLRNMISTLKRYLPELITIVVNDERDAAEMISLINHGQVFRYMSKPMDEGRLLQNVNAAVLRHIELRENPELVQRHTVVPDRPPREESATLAQFIGRIKEMRRFWMRT